ncbi:MAG: hypothetical protein HZB35_08650 [Nitrospirae bacterium]|nr:hypothetical protein [Nitrospirota bacterium]
MQSMGRVDAMRFCPTWAMVTLVGAAALTWVGCSSSPPPAPAQPTTQQIRGDSDRFFDKMKQEEKERGGMK